MGALGLLSLAQSTWVTPAAIVGGLYYGLAGISRIIRGRLIFADGLALTYLIFAYSRFSPCYLANRGLKFSARLLGR